MSNVELINFISSISSLILSIIAIILSLYFFKQSKDTEKNVENSLNSITIHGSLLEKLTSRWMDKFTNYVTTPHQADETTNKLLEIVSFRHTTQVQIDDTHEKTKELISSYIINYFYAGLANLALQDLLPTQISELEDNDTIRKLVDNSNSDYFLLKNTLESIDSQLLDLNPQKANYEVARRFEENVKDTLTFYQGKSKELGSQT